MKIRYLLLAGLVALVCVSVRVGDTKLESRALSSNAANSVAPTSVASSRVQCADISDRICNDLWSKEHKGFLKVSDGEIRVGVSPKSHLDVAVIEYWRSLVESEPYLPSDFRQTVHPILTALAVDLAHEAGALAWKKRAAAHLYRWRNAIDDVAEARAIERAPSLKKLTEADLTFDQTVFKQRVANKLRAQIIEAQYLHHPNWLRVERVFAQVKQDLVAALASLNITLEQRQELAAKIQSVKLSLPYSDPDRLGLEESCSTTEKNAMYVQVHNAFSVCAGFFNSLASDTSLYRIMAHEISHSIDPIAFAKDQWRLHSPLSHQLKRLIGSHGKAIPCDEWANVIASVKSYRMSARIEKYDSARQPLYDCFHPKSELNPFSLDSQKEISDMLARGAVSSDATVHHYLLAAQPTFIKEGVSKQNEFYLRPDRILISESDNTPTPHVTRGADPIEIFTQSLLCDSRDFLKAPKTLRGQIFKDAIADAEAVMRVKVAEYLTYCGQNCEELVQFKMSFDSKEDFADWLASKAVTRNLERLKDQRSRREAISLMGVADCVAPGPENDAPELALIEKSFSQEEHPDTRARRLSMFSLRNAELADCEMPPQEQGFLKCDL